MRLTVLGGCGAFPEPGGACSGFLVEQDGFRLLLDVGYATVPRLLRHVGAEGVDAVLVSHGHPDHCADLNPLLRARVMREHPAPALPVYALPGVLDPVLALDRPATLASAYALHEFDAGERLSIGPFEVSTRLLPHSVPNAGTRLTAGGRTLVYTGDAGPGPDLMELAREADLLLAEATYVDAVPEPLRHHLNSAREAGRQAALSGVGQLLLTHLWPGTDPAAAVAAAADRFRGPVQVATAGRVLDLD